MSEQLSWTPPRGLGLLGGPAVLAFTSDDFLAELEAALEQDPPALAPLVAVAEHWSQTQPPPYPVPVRPAPAPRQQVTLFQPAHGRFYLVAASLVCRRYGRPDHRLGPEESAGFVVRRLEPAAGVAALDPADPSSSRELAWLPAAAGGGRWAEVAQRRRLVPGEELRPLAPTWYRDGGRRVRLLTGLVPVSAREHYEARPVVPAAVTDETAADDPMANPERALLDATVIDAFRQLEQFQGLPSPAPDGAARVRPPTAAREEMLALALVDLLDFVTEVAGEPVQDFAERLTGVARSVPSGEDDVDVTWGEVVTAAGEQRDALVSGGEVAEPLGDHLAAVDVLSFGPLVEELEAYAAELEPPAADPDGGPGDGPAGSGPLLGGAYVLRCVYRRAGCPHDRPEWVSEPAGPFHFASFFDPDAPGRPVQISLPVDTSPRGLRQFPRTVQILVSSQLRKQMSQVRGLDDIRGPDGSLQLGMLCSLSIPIITICALVLLMVVVVVLNLVFFWLPFFKVCLPVPKPEER